MFSQNIIKRGVLFVAVSLAWPMFVAMSTILLPDAILPRVERIGHLKSVYTTGFWCMIFIAPALLPLLSKISAQMNLVYSKSVQSMLYVYAFLVTIVNLNQIFFFPRTISVLHLEFAASWYVGNPHALPFYLNQLAYGLLGIALFLLFAKEVEKNSGALRKLIISLLIAALFFMIGLVLAAFQQKNALFSSYLGMLCFIPFSFYSVAYGIAESKKTP